MKLEKTREALNWAGTHSEGFGCGRYSLIADAVAEVGWAESVLERAQQVQGFAVAGLSAFHGRLCGMAPGAYPENASECADPKCRAWAAAVSGNAPTDTAVEMERLREQLSRTTEAFKAEGKARLDAECREKALRAQVADLDKALAQADMHGARNAELEEAALLVVASTGGWVSDPLPDARTVKEALAHGIRALKRGG